MGLFGKSNQCPFKAQCPTEEICSHVADSSYQDCNLYEDWSGGGVNENNSCPYKDECHLYPYNCLWGEHPRDCFHHNTFARKHGDVTSYDDDDDAVEDNDNNTTSFDQILSGESHRESESERAARIAAERKQAQLDRELDIAKSKLNLKESNVVKRKKQKDMKQSRSIESN